MYLKRDSEFFTIVRVSGKDVPDKSFSYFKENSITIRINFTGEVFYENLRDIFSEGEILINKNYNLGEYRILTPNIDYVLINLKESFLKTLGEINFKEGYINKLPWFLSRKYLDILKDFKNCHLIDLVLLKMVGELLLELDQRSDFFNLDEHLKLLRDMEKYILENIENKITVHKVEKKFLLNKNSVVKIFLDNFNMYPSEYILNKKLETVAKKLLLGGERVLDISVDLDFSSPSFLARAFKDKYGLTPLHFRKRKRISIAF